MPIASFKLTLLYCFSFKLFQYFTLEIAMESFWIIHLDGSLCIQEIVYLRITWSRKVSKHYRYISGFFTRTSDEARTAALISKYAQVWVTNHHRWTCISMEKLARISRQIIIIIHLYSAFSTRFKGANVTVPIRNTVHNKHNLLISKTMLLHVRFNFFDIFLLFPAKQ